MEPGVTVETSFPVKKQEIEQAVEINELVYRSFPFDGAVATDEVALLQLVQSARQSASVRQAGSFHNIVAGIAAAPFAESRDDFHIFL